MKKKCNEFTIDGFSGWRKLVILVLFGMTISEDGLTSVASPSGKDICKDQPDELIRNLKNLANSRLFPDVVFKVGGEEIPAHKAILAHRSDYFMKMFTSKKIYSTVSIRVLGNRQSWKLEIEREIFFLEMIEKRFFGLFSYCQIYIPNFRIK